MQKTGQGRYTPPTNVMAALRVAIDQFLAEGGQPARLARYRRNCDALINGMRALGLESFLPTAIQAPIIVTFHAPPDPAYEFGDFYRRVREQGFILYPGKLTSLETFRMGCIGAIDEQAMRAAVAAVAHVLRQIGVRSVARSAEKV